ncbi:MAG: TIR domain-containing protein [Solirubrobacterales bacterium]
MTRKTRVFVSFDFDNDAKLKTFILAQAKHPDSPFEIENWSLNEAAPQATWKEKAKKRIARSDVVLVMVGPETYKAPGVLAEIAAAEELKVPVRQMIGYKDASPRPVPGAGRLYRWSWPTLKTILTIS